MSYSNFTLNSVLKQFHLTLKDKQNLFTDTSDITPSEHLTTTLNYNLPLASEINTEKSRSEMIIAPILRKKILGILVRMITSLLSQEERENELQ